MHILIVLAGFILSSSAFTLSDVVREEWNTFKLTYDKLYEDEAEELLRMETFMQNKMMIEKHNQNYEEGLETYSMAINEFSDFMPEELDRMLGGFEFSQNSSDFDEAIRFTSPENIDLPNQVDWRTKRLVTDVKNQGYRCGSCWAFSAAGAIEGQNAKVNGKLISLSPQDLVDCSHSQPNEGCRGGNAYVAFSDLKKMGGIESEQSYPYRGVTGRCHFNRAKVEVIIQNIGVIAQGNENELMKAVAQVGPISAGMLWDRRLTNYHNGIFHVNHCNPNGRHAVLIVGYGTENGMDYWLVKNSYGKQWGNGGYFKIARNKHNLCDIASESYYPIVKRRN